MSGVMGYIVDGSVEVTIRVYGKYCSRVYEGEVEHCPMLGGFEDKKKCGWFTTAFDPGHYCFKPFGENIVLKEELDRSCGEKLAVRCDMCVDRFAPAWSGCKDKDSCDGCLCLTCYVRDRRSSGCVACVNYHGNKNRQCASYYKDDE